MKHTSLKPGQLDARQLVKGARTTEQFQRLKKVVSMRNQRYTWADIGRELGITRQRARAIALAYLNKHGSA